MIRLRLRHLLLFALLLTSTGAWAAFDMPLESIASVHKNGSYPQKNHIKGVVTFADTAMFFLQDETGVMPVQFARAKAELNEGDEIETQGLLVRLAAGFQLQVSSIEKTGTRPLPEPEVIPLKGLFNGGAYGQRVRTRAVVHDVALVGNEVQLLLQAWLDPAQSVGPGSNTFIFRWKPGESEPLKRPDHLLDSVVEINAVAARSSTPDGRFFGLGKLFIHSADDIKVIEPGNADVFTRPQRSLNDLREKLGTDATRVRVRGTVTYYSEAGWFYFQDETGTARAGKPNFLSLPPDQRRSTQSNPPLHPGDNIELVGLPFHKEHDGSFMPWFIQSEWRITDHVAPPPFEALLPATILHGNYDGRSVTLIGQVTDVSVKRDDAGFYHHYVTLDDDGVVFAALLLKREMIDLPVKTGGYARIDGIVMAEQDETGVTKKFRLNINEPTDLRPTTRPWRPAYLFPWLLGIAAVVLAAVVWILLLRRQVRQQTAKLLAANDELSRFKQVADTSTDFIAMGTLENQPLYMNPAGRAMLGIAQDAEVGSISYEATTTPEARELMMTKGFAHAFQHGHWHAELNMRKLSGEDVPVSFLGLIIKSPDGKPQYIASVARDISERRALERQLRESNHELLRFKAIADTMNDLVAMAGLDRKPLYINAAGRAMLGIGADEDPATIDFDSIYTRESIDLFEREGYAHAFKHGHWSAEVSLLHRNGREIPVMFSGLVLYKPDGSPLCMSCIAHDLTRRFSLEKQLRASLDHERELNQLKSGFVNTISHEFRTPLGIILFASSMLRRFNASFSAEERATQLDAIDEAVERMNELVEQSLSLGRAEIAAPKKSTFDVRKFCSRVIDEVMSSTSHHSPITLESDDALPAAHTDEMMLRTILANLLGNAVKYSPAGSPILLRIKHGDGDKAEFVIRDHGRGLSEEDLPKLFTTFYRGKDVQDIPGSGLGLAIVKRCAEALGGSVTARDAPDGGAEFVVILPIFTSPTS